MHILIAEDNRDHAELLIETFNELCPKIKITHKSNGEEAIKFLENLLSAAAKLPDMILLDIKMPRMNGIEALIYLKKNRSLMAIPVAMLSTSSNSPEIDVCLRQGAFTYISKPLLLADFRDKILPQLSKNPC